MTANGLRAREGRDTNALNCKPITNLKEKYELSNYCKTSGFILHAVIASCPRPGSLKKSIFNSHNIVRSPTNCQASFLQ
jgi:hypothetical protein